jgi:hypothetical protein
MELNLEENQNETIVKKKRGRPPTSDIKNNKNYFNEYYAKSNVPVTCQCGLTVKKRMMNIHKKSRIHNMILLAKNENIEKLN